ncbi:MAG: translational machinery protein [Rhizobiaceae bacterium]
MPNTQAQTQHAVVWIDHRQARVFFLTRDTADEITLDTSKTFDQAHKHAGTREGNRTPTDDDFLHEVVEALKPAQEWLIIGPGIAKEELAKHVKHHDHLLADRIIAVEPADHPTDGQIVAMARKFFKAADRMIG